MQVVGREVYTSHMGGPGRCPFRGEVHPEGAGECSDDVVATVWLGPIARDNEHNHIMEGSFDVDALLRCDLHSVSSSIVGTTWGKSPI